MPTFAVSGSTAVSSTHTATRVLVRVRFGTSAVSIAQTATQTISDFFNLAGSSSVSTAQAASGIQSFTLSGSSSVAIAQAAAAALAKGRQGETAIVVSHVASVNIIKNFSVTHALRVTQGGYPQEAILDARVYFLLNGADILELPHPLCPDTEKLILQTQVRHSRNGDRYQYKRTPTYRILSLDFENIKQTDLESLEAFFELAAGEDLVYIDHYQQNWIGTIITDPIEFKALCKFLPDCPGGRTELYGFSLEFEGMRQT
jgi:hypothetical protein